MELLICNDRLHIMHNNILTQDKIPVPLVAFKTLRTLL